MPKLDKPELTLRWWQDIAPKGLRSGGKLERAFKEWEAARKRLDRKIDSENLEDADDRLATLNEAIDAAAAEAAKSKTIPDGASLSDALRKLDHDIGAEKSAIDKLADDHAARDFATPEAYRVYLLRWLKRVDVKKPMNFALVLGRSPEEHRMALHKSKAGKALMGLLVRETKLHAVTFGAARGDEKRGDELVLAVEGKQLSGMGRRGTLMLKEYQPLPFKHIRLTVGGKDAADIEDD